MNDVTLSWQRLLPEKLRKALGRVADSRKASVFAAGGIVRDFLLLRTCRDVDLVVFPDPIPFTGDLASILKSPMFILDEQEQVARVVWKTEIDVSGFRSGSLSIEEDLNHRDFTINAMALPFSNGEDADAEKVLLIDPHHGMSDLQDKVIRVVSPSTFAADPLRLLRAYRFAATLGFTIEGETAAMIASQKERIGQSAPERIKYEMDLLLSAPKSAAILQQMQKSGLLFELFPQLRDLEGVRQPLSHHLDVFDHSLATLQHLEEVLVEPARFFPESPSVGDYLLGDRRKDTAQVGGSLA